MMMENISPDNLSHDSGEHLVHADSLIDGSTKVPIVGIEGIDLAHPDGGEHLVHASSFDFPEASIGIKSSDSADVDTGSIFDDGYSVFDDDGYSVFDDDGYSVFNHSESNVSDPREDARHEYNEAFEDLKAIDEALKRAQDERKDKMDGQLRYIDSFNEDLISMTESINAKVEQYKPLAEAVKLLKVERDGLVSDAEARKDIFDREKAESRAALEAHNDAVVEYNSAVSQGTATQSDRQAVLELKEKHEKEFKESQKAEKDFLRAKKVATPVAQVYDALIDKVSALGREIEKMENSYESYLAEVQVKTAPGWATYVKLSNKVSGLEVKRAEAKGRLDAATARLEKLTLKEKN